MIWVVTAVVSVLVVVGAVAYVRLGGTTHSLPEVAPVAAAKPTPTPAGQRATPCAQVDRK
ncbi:hypothetical protein AB0J72_08590 [Dactylosporangium sp. NPDC049742]|uniref:hypothetical protein n=1 Tax=Dactylosporangium sp. NPDC049742 TaxID=3154737 RepID=UPI00342170C6